ncbi:MAG: putative rane protein [Lachnospiraceae bacterium]|jgi:chromate transporter|nr:putative rane protein [Lachnospiraceae bacterium]
MIYLKLLWSFIQIGLFSIGGGYATLPLIQNQVVVLNKWLTLTEFADLITIAEMTPGPIAINSATFVGIRIAGLPGALVATFGCVLPSVIIVLTLAYIYGKYKNLVIVQGVLSGLRPAVVAFITSAGISLFTLALWGEDFTASGIGGVNPVAVFLFVLALFILRKYKLNPLIVMFGTGIVGMIVYLV